MSQTAGTVLDAAAQAAAAQPEGVLNKRVRQYLLLREKIAEMDERHKAERKVLTDPLLALNAAILEELNRAGVDSINVRGVGTAYKTVKRSASIAAPDEFRRFVIGGQLFDLLDWKVNLTAATEYAEAHGDLPPGVTIKSAAVVGVRSTPGE
jgi:hypothetical protein